MMLKETLHQRQTPRGSEEEEVASVEVALAQEITVQSSRGATSISHGKKMIESSQRPPPKRMIMHQMSFSNDILEEFPLISCHHMLTKTITP